MKNWLRGAIYLSLASSIWGAMFIAVRLSVTVIPPVQLVWLRYVTAGITLYFLGRSMGVSWKIQRKDWKLVFLVGLIGQTISIVTQETGTMLTSAQTGSIVTASTPAFMVIFGYIVLKEKLTLGRISSVLLATVGVLLIVADPDNFQITGVWGGLFLTVAALTWALMSVLLKLLKGYSPVVITSYGVLVAIILLGPYSLWWLTTTNWMPFSTPTVWGSVLYLGIVSTTGGFCLWNKGLLLMDASVAGLFLFLQPVVGTFLGWLLLNEPITLYFWIGTALVFTGVTLAMHGGTENLEKEKNIA